MRAPTECTVLSIAAWNTAVLGLVLHSVVKVGFAVSVKNLMNQLHAWCVFFILGHLDSQLMLSLSSVPYLMKQTRKKNFRKMFDLCKNKQQILH